MVDKNCECCGKAMKVRAADIKRGWGRFCSKSCKASAQERRTGQYALFKATNEGRSFLGFEEDINPFKDG